MEITATTGNLYPLSLTSALTNYKNQSDFNFAFDVPPVKQGERQNWMHTKVSYFDCFLKVFIH